ncbi:cytochrome P450 [Elsinoe ampelina]|uniref:Cytochrome P450 n=1 Tax=Elsinoe ampelina TaxID=302913 RepID=A0A6A6G610_9PEZI|nr:cytochrome P450 [Elsinoe ampelina]
MAVISTITPLADTRSATVGVNAWVIHHDPAVYGQDHESFRPERWLKGNKGDMERYFCAFGGGQRLCIVKNISMIEMSNSIPYFFDEFEVSLADPERELEEDSASYFRIFKADMIVTGGSSSRQVSMSMFDSELGRTDWAPPFLITGVDEETVKDRSESLCVCSLQKTD